MVKNVDADDGTSVHYVRTMQGPILMKNFGADGVFHHSVRALLQVLKYTPYQYIVYIYIYYVYILRIYHVTPNKKKGYNN